MKKLLFAGVIAIVVVLGFASCGSYDLAVAEPAYPYYYMYPYGRTYYYYPSFHYYYRPAPPPPPRRHHPRR